MGCAATLLLKVLRPLSQPRPSSATTGLVLFENDVLNTPSTYSPDTAVPLDKRVFGARDLFSLWFSLGVGLMVLQTGALLAPGLGLSGSLLAIFLGTLVGVALLVYAPSAFAKLRHDS